MKRANNPTEVSERWELYKLPKHMTGKSFLDVGCWSGGFVEEAHNRGAHLSVGVDKVLDSMWSVRALGHENISFYVMDVFDSHFLTLPQFDYVLCSGVFYHVHDPVGLLVRLKVVTKKLLILETAYREGYPCGDGTPTLSYCYRDSFDSNPSNWFLPNEPLVRRLASDLGFDVEDAFKVGEGRMCFHLSPYGKLSKKILPRKPEFLTL